MYTNEALPITKLFIQKGNVSPCKQTIGILRVHTRIWNLAYVILEQLIWNPLGQLPSFLGATGHGEQRRYGHRSISGIPLPSSRMYRVN